MVDRSQFISAIENRGRTLLQFWRKTEIQLSNSHDLKKFRNGHLSDLFSYTNIEQEDINKYVDEILDNRQIHEAQKRLAGASKAYGPPARCVAIYVLTRYFKPRVCIETGVRHGESSVYLLEALRRNGGGELYSIDVPSPNLPDGRSPGWIIPDKTRTNWTLITGKSQNKLEPLLENIGNLDMFFHDSYHKYPLMKWEFSTTLKYMDNGIVASDDINRNHAFLELCSTVNSTVNIEKPYKIGGKGVFGFAFVGDDVQNQGIKMAEHR